MRISLDQASARKTRKSENTKTSRQVKTSSEPSKSTATSEKHNKTEEQSKATAKGDNSKSQNGPIIENVKPPEVTAECGLWPLLGSSSDPQTGEKNSYVLDTYWLLECNWAAPTAQKQFRMLWLL